MTLSSTWQLRSTRTLTGKTLPTRLPPLSSPHACIHILQIFRFWSSLEFLTFFLTFLFLQDSALISFYSAFFVGKCAFSYLSTALACSLRLNIQANSHWVSPPLHCPLTITQSLVRGHFISLTELQTFHVNEKIPLNGSPPSSQASLDYFLLQITLETVN